MENQIKRWKDLKYWQTGEWQVIDERLKELKKKGRVVNPTRDKLFAALDLCPFDTCRLCILGQDPYPNSEMATGLAFSVPKEIKKLPPSLQNILQVYQDDLHLPHPGHGDLTAWAEQGVLLWNAIPSCEEGHAASHKDWFEWDYLTQEIIEQLSAKGIVFGLFGGFARKFKKYINEESNAVIETAHPSPLAEMKASDNAFSKSRFFSTANAELIRLGKEPINWRLP